ncbi:MAG: DUF4384 domain-containing protein [Thermodesulfobacteriota bacterium]
MGSATARLTSVFLALAALLCAAFTAHAETTMEARDMVVEEASKIRSDNPDFKIQLKVAGKKDRIAIGDTVGFQFTANRDAYVTILDIGSSGKVHVVFPNKWHKSNKVEKGKVYRIPGKDDDYEFRVKGPKGVNFVKAVGTLKPFDWLQREALIASKEEGLFDEVKEPVKVLKDLGVELAKKDKKGWTETETNFTIVSDKDKSAEADDESEDVSERDAKKIVAKLWTDKKEYHVGSPVTFYFYCEKDCYLHLVDFGTSGKVRLVFPNRFQKDNFVKGGEVITIPTAKEDEFRFRVKGPKGTERVKAVVTTQKAHFYKGALDFEKDVYAEWDEDAEAIEKDLDVRLSEMPVHVRTKVWTKFKVVK